MAKEDILLREEMERLEIEPLKINPHRSEENPFVSQRKRGISKRTQNSLCSCGSIKKNTINGFCKKKHNKILNEPVLNILKTCVGHNIFSKEECAPEASSAISHTVNSDSLNLCTLVKNCNQLKISSRSNKEIKTRDPNDKTKWWKNEVGCTSENREHRQSNQTGSCSQQALNPPCDVTIDELASYFETLVHIPKKMSSMAEMMYI